MAINPADFMTQPEGVDPSQFMASPVASPKPAGKEASEEFGRELTGNAAQIGDMLLGLPQAISHFLEYATLRGTASVAGLQPKQGAQAAEQTLAEKEKTLPGGGEAWSSPLSTMWRHAYATDIANDPQKADTMFGDAMQRVMGYVPKAGQWIEEKSGGVIPKEDVVEAAQGILAGMSPRIAGGAKKLLKTIVKGPGPSKAKVAKGAESLYEESQGIEGKSVADQAAAETLGELGADGRDPTVQHIDNYARASKIADEIEHDQNSPEAQELMQRNPLIRTILDRKKTSAIWGVQPGVQIGELAPLSGAGSETIPLHEWEQAFPEEPGESGAAQDAAAEKPKKGSIESAAAKGEKLGPDWGKLVIAGAGVTAAYNAYQGMTDEDKKNILEGAAVAAVGLEGKTMGELRARLPVTSKVFERLNPDSAAFKVSHINDLAKQSDVSALEKKILGEILKDHDQRDISAAKLTEAFTRFTQPDVLKAENERRYRTHGLDELYPTVGDVTLEGDTPLDEIPLNVAHQTAQTSLYNFDTETNPNRIFMPKKILPDHKIHFDETKPLPFGHVISHKIKRVERVTEIQGDLPQNLADLKPKEIQEWQGKYVGALNDLRKVEESYKELEKYRAKLLEEDKEGTPEWRAAVDWEESNTRSFQSAQQDLEEARRHLGFNEERARGRKELGHFGDPIRVIASAHIARRIAEGEQKIQFASANTVAKAEQWIIANDEIFKQWADFEEATQGTLEHTQERIEEAEKIRDELSLPDLIKLQERIIARYKESFKVLKADHEKTRKRLKIWKKAKEGGHPLFRSLGSQSLHSKYLDFEKLLEKMGATRLPPDKYGNVWLELPIGEGSKVRGDLGLVSRAGIPFHAAAAAGIASTLIAYGLMEDKDKKDNAMRNALGIMMVGATEGRLARLPFYRWVKENPHNAWKIGAYTVGAFAGPSIFEDPRERGSWSANRGANIEGALAGYLALRYIPLSWYRSKMVPKSQLIQAISEKYGDAAGKIAAKHYEAAVPEVLKHLGWVERDMERADVFEMMTKHQGIQGAVTGEANLGMAVVDQMLKEGITPDKTTELYLLEKGKPLSKMSKAAQLSYTKYLEPLRLKGIRLANEYSLLTGKPLQITLEHFMPKYYTDMESPAARLARGYTGLTKPGAVPSAFKDPQVFSVEGREGVYTKYKGQIWWWKNGQKTLIGRMGKGFEGSVGDELKVNGTEFGKIKQATKVDVEEHSNKKAWRDPVMAQLMYNLELTRAVAEMQFAKELSSRPDFMKVIASPVNIAKPGWKTLNSEVLDKMPKEFRNFRFSPRWHEAITDMAHVDPRGFWGKVTTLMVKALMIDPIVHMLNEGVHWFTEGGISSWGAPIQKLNNLRNAWDSVKNQDKGQLAMAKAGASLFMPERTLSNRIRAYNKLERDMTFSPTFEGMARALGLKSLEAAAYITDRMGDYMWMTRDTFVTQLVLENRRLHSGMSTETAVAKVMAGMPSYQLPPRIMEEFWADFIGEKMGAKASRLQSKLMGNPLLTAFSRYHYGVMKEVSGMAQNATRRTGGVMDMERLRGPEAELKMGEIEKSYRRHALDAISAAAAIGFGYQVMDGFAQWIAGKMGQDPESAKFGRRGYMHQYEKFYNMLKGDPNAGLYFLLSLISTPLSTSLPEGVFGVTEAGTPLYDRNAPPEEKVYQSFKHIAAKFAPGPFGMMVDEYRHPGKSGAGAFLSGINIESRTPEAAEHLEMMRERDEAAKEKYLDKMELEE